MKERMDVRGWERTDKVNNCQFYRLVSKRKGISKSSGLWIETLQTPPPPLKESKREIISKREREIGA